MTYNKISVAFGALRKVTAPAINYQYDVTQVLVIKGLNLPEYYVVDFCNEGDATVIPITGTSDGVEIPDALLLTGKVVKGYIVVAGSDGDVQTRYEVKIPVNARPQRADAEPTEAQQQVIDSLIAALNSGVTSAEEAAARAEIAITHSPRIVGGYWYLWNAESEEYVNTGVKAQGVDGKDGEDGDDGESPSVTITVIEGGHRITITDKDHPQGQTFDVMDGTSGSGGVQSVNGKTGVVTLTASDVGAKPSSYEAPVASVAGKTGTVLLNAGDSSYDSTATYGSGTVGAELTELTRHLSDLDTDKQDKTNYVTLSGTIITQTGVDNTVYLCGELAELTFTAPATGITVIRFTSGSTPTVITLNGITMPDDWTGVCEANKRYDIGVLNGDGLYCARTVT